MPTRVFMSLGSNLGDRLLYLRSGLVRLRDLESLAVRRVSSVYRTEAVGGRTDKEFLNAVVECETECDLRNVLPILKGIERTAGRVERHRWGDRELDIDMLYGGDTVLTTVTMKVPHPEVPRRRFVFVPLCELAPGFVDPLTGKRMIDLLRECPGKERVEAIDEKL
jgi:2-amino-4-hydroxy-6-hydroxymethyldihydropteridine diphosphokinase